LIAGVILAAGTSSRLGRPKQLLELAGKPVLQHVLDVAEASLLDEMVVVLGHNAAEVEGAVRLSHRARVTHNPDYAEGQSTSFHAGLRATGPDADAAVVLLGDQPGLRTEVIDSVIEAYRGGAGPVVQASYSGQPAHPTLFARSVWPQLEAVRGDRGARAVLEAHPEWRTLVDVGGEPPDDIDTEQDYARVRQAMEGSAS
jgi:molybdenum cofactor cytidylyltransferase